MTNTTTKSSSAYGRNRCVKAVWAKAKTIRVKDPNLYRKDTYGNTIYHGSYGKSTTVGWHIDHKVPVSRGGLDGLGNLQPMQAHKNMSLGNSMQKRK